MTGAVSIPTRILSLLSRSTTPLATGEIAEKLQKRSGVIAARMLELEDRGQVVRTDGSWGRGSRAVWRAVR